MRRLLAAAALATLCAATAACTSDKESAPGASGSASTSASASAAAGVAAAGNTKQVCDDVRKLITDSSTRFSQEMTKALQAAGSGDESANQAALATLRKLFTGWADALREQGAKAADADFKTALTTTADRIDDAANNIKSMNDLQRVDQLLDAPELNDANAQLEKYCG